MLRTLLGTKLMIEQKGRQAFNLDTILLADFVKVPAKTKVLMDFGTGAGALMLYMSQKTKASIVGVEVQEQRYLQALHNIKLNHLEPQVTVLHQDVRTIDMKDVDCIISNPPFFKVSEGSNKNESEDDTIARHEVMLTLDELISSASRTLKYGGHFYMIHRPDRFAEIVSVMNKYHIEIKRVRFVHPYFDREANHVLIQGIKNGQSGMTLESPLILYVEKHILTKEMVSIYGGRENVTEFIK
ncbi:MAG: methyltransferase [Acholeplasmataceae bacterium]|nr:methyltransferase [Acholeplasmataceae bacterium]